MPDAQAPKPRRRADVRGEVGGRPSADDDLGHERPTWAVLHGPQAMEWDPTPLVRAFGFQVRLNAVEDFVVNAGPIILVFVGLILVAAGLLTAHDVVSIVGVIFGVGGGATAVAARRRHR